MHCRSNLFILRENQFSGEGVEAVVRLGEDSLFHPNSTCVQSGGEGFLVRTKEGLGPRPFSDSYHKVSLDCNVLSWQMEETRLRLEGPPGASRSTAILFSEDFFEQELFQQMQGIDPIHL